MMVAGGVVAGGGAVRRGHCDRRARPTRLGWLDGLGRQLDALTDAVLGEAATSEIGDGCAEAYEGETSAAAAAEEAAAAAGFDGATLAALLVGRWGQEYDIDFTKTDYLGKSSLYLNVFPWTADQEPWCATRHTPHATRHTPHATRHTPRHATPAAVFLVRAAEPSRCLRDARQAPHRQAGLPRAPPGGGGAAAPVGACGVGEASDRRE